MPGSKYSVFWTDTALADLEGIIIYIAVDSVDNAQSVFSKLTEKAGTLHLHPERGRIVPELKFHSIENYREIIINPWRIVYRIHGNSVYVMAVFDGRRNIEEILLERFLRNNL